MRRYLIEYNQANVLQLCMMDTSRVDHLKCLSALFSFCYVFLLSLSLSLSGFVTTLQVRSRARHIHIIFLFRIKRRAGIMTKANGQMKETNTHENKSDDMR